MIPKRQYQMADYPWWLFTTGRCSEVSLLRLIIAKTVSRGPARCLLARVPMCQKTGVSHRVGRVEKGHLSLA